MRKKELQPGHEFYEKAKECEMNKEYMEAVKWYRKAERMGHSLRDEIVSSAVDYSEHPCKWVKAPVDDEGFIQSFTVDETEEYVKFFHEYGFVIVNNVLSKSEIQDTKDAIWDEVCKLSFIQQGSDDNKFIKPDSNDSDSCNDDLWPRSAIPAGLLGINIMWDKASMNNRKNPNVAKVFAKVLGSPRIVTHFGRYGIMRPTKNLPARKTISRWYHWDLNPWGYYGMQEPDSLTEDELTETLLTRPAAIFMSENNTNTKFRENKTFKVQGILNFNNSTENDGGFCCVPGFHHFLEKWSQLTPPYSTGDLVDVPEDDELFNHGQKITLRAGSLVIWDSRLPHCNFPNNDSPHFRMVQYIRMCTTSVMPSEDSKAWDARKRAVESAIKTHNYTVELSPREQRLFNLQPYS